MSLARWTLIGLAALTLGCASITRPPLFDARRIRSIEQGVTTQAEIEQWFGEPTDFEVRATGTSVWRYERRRRELDPSSSSRCRTGIPIPSPAEPCRFVERRAELEVRFTAEGVVASFALDQALVAAPSIRRNGYPPYPPPSRDPIADATGR